MEEIMNAGMIQAQESVQTGTAQVPAETTLSEMLEVKAEGTENVPQDAETEQHEDHEQNESQNINGGIRGRLLESEKKGEKRGYAAGYQAALSETQAKMDAMSKQLEELSEYKLREEAAALAKEEGCSEKLAMRILRAEKGLAPAVQEKAEKSRDESGRFVAKENKNDGSTERAQFLFNQAKAIKEQTGMDALELFNNADAETREKIARGDMDFNALVLASMSKAQKSPPMVKPTSGGLTKRISDMTSEDFAKLDAYAKNGGAIRIV